MPRFRYAQNSFSSGRLSRRTLARSDTTQYQTGASEIKNFIPIPQGPLIKRPGGEFVMHSYPLDDQTSSSSSAKCRIIPFIVSKSESYAVMIFARDTSGTPGRASSIKIYNLNTKTSVAFAYAPDITIGDTISTLTSSTLSAVRDTRSPRGWDADELQEIKFAQSNDVMILVHPDVSPIAIRRNGENNFEVVPYQYAFLTGRDNPSAALLGRRLPFEDINTDTSHTMTPSGVTGSITITSSLAYFVPEYKGTYIRIDSATKTGIAQITSVTSAFVVAATVIIDFDATAASDQWKMGAWSDANGWPRSVAFSSGRLLFGGNKKFPSTIWGSQVDDFGELAIPDFLGDATLADDDAYAQELRSNTSDKIQWMVAWKNLVIGTEANEFIVENVESTSNFAARVETSHGSSYVQPVLYGNSILFVARGGKKLVEFKVYVDASSYRSDWINIASDDLAEVQASELSSFDAPEFLGLSYQESTNSATWAYDNNGGLISISRDLTANVAGPGRHVLGGNLDGENPKVVSMAVIPFEDGQYDNVWLCVERTINGATQYYIERLLNDYRDGTINNSFTDIIRKPVYTDSASYQNQSGGATTFGGLSHLVAESVQILGDGKYLGSKTVSDGTNLISNPSAATDTTGWATFDDTMTISAIDATANTLTLSSNELRVGQAVIYRQGATNIGGLSNNGLYFVASVSGNDIVLTAGKGSSAVDITGALPGGTHTLELVNEPGNGTGGSPNIVLARTTTFPTLGGTGLEITKPASACLGEGFGINFTINARDKGKRLKVEFQYTDSGSVGDDYWVVGILDTTNSVMIPMEGYKAFAPSTQKQRRFFDYNSNSSKLFENASLDTVYTFTDFFNAASDSTTYRLVIMLNKDNAGAGVLYVTGVSIKSTGYITLDESVSDVIAGLSYDSVMQSVDIEAGSATGTSQGARKRIDEVTTRFDRTIGGSIGGNEDSLNEIIFREQSLSPLNPIPLFTGDKTMEIRTNDERKNQVYFLHDVPFPCTILGFFARGETVD